jgi:hypothetical protein
VKHERSDTDRSHSNKIIVMVTFNPEVALRHTEPESRQTRGRLLDGSNEPRVEDYLSISVLSPPGMSSA